MAAACDALTILDAVKKKNEPLEEASGGDKGKRPPARGQASVAGVEEEDELDS